MKSLREPSHKMLLVVISEPLNCSAYLSPGVQEVHHPLRGERNPKMFLCVGLQAAHFILLSLAEKAVAGRYVLPVKGLRYMNAVLMSDLYICNDEDIYYSFLYPPHFSIKNNGAPHLVPLALPCI